MRGFDLLVNILFPEVVATTLIVALTGVPVLRLGLAMLTLIAFFWALGKLDAPIGDTVARMLSARQDRLGRGISSPFGRIIK